MSDTARHFSDHPEAELLLFVADEATAAQRAAVTEHLAGCAECRASLTELRETLHELDARPTADMSDPAWERTLRAAMSPRVVLSVGRGAWRSSPMVAAGLVAAVFLLAVLSFALLGARQEREVERLRAELRDARAQMVVAMLREPESAERLRGVALGGPLLGQDARVAAAFVTVLRTDPSPNVRLAVLDAVDAAPRHAQLATEILMALPAEPQPAVRLAMIDLVAELGDPRAQDALSTLASGDPDPSVRARARAAADRFSSRPSNVLQ
jgi:hypothetical protein